MAGERHGMCEFAFSFMVEHRTSCTSKDSNAEEDMLIPALSVPSLALKFNPNGQPKWTTWRRMNLRPEAKYDIHCDDFYSVNRKKNVKIAEKISCTPGSKAWLSMHQLSRTEN
jgi:hypothetical protein